MTCQESLYLLQLMSGMENECELTLLTIAGDNQGAIALSKNPVSHQRKKSMNTRYDFVRSAFND